MSKLTRRRFIRLSMLAATAAFAVACDQAPPSPADGEKAKEGGKTVPPTAKPATAEPTTVPESWIEQAIVYGVIPRNFGPAGFRSISDKLAYLQDLGVNAIWLAPVNVSPEGDYGYAVADYLKLNPKYGSEADFRQMVQQAHERGIRVLMDFVPNHTSDTHPWFRDTVLKGKESPYYDYYDRDAKGNPTYYFNWLNLLNLNYSNPVVQQEMIKSLAYWIKDFDIDGYRLDAVWGIVQRNPEFWPKAIAELRKIKPDLLMLAEASARDPYYITHGFDAAYDWTDALGHGAWERVFDDPTQIPKRLHAALTNEGRGFAPGSRNFRFLNNNDTGARFITRYGLRLTQVATALLLTLPGIPCIYTGDEIGAEFEPYGNPQPISWTGNEALHDYHKELIALRKTYPSLHSQQWQPLEASPENQFYAYLRYLEPAERPVLVVLNFMDKAGEAVIQIPEKFQALTQMGSLTDLLGKESLPMATTNPVHVPMAEFSARILTIA